MLLKNDTYIATTLFNTGTLYSTINANITANINDITNDIAAIKRVTFINGNISKSVS